jgi:nitrate reductase NapE component
MSAGSPPQNLPTEPVDMFDEVDKGGNTGASLPPNAIEAGLLKKKTIQTEPVVSSMPQTMAPSPQQQNTMPAVSYDMKQPLLGKVLLFILLAVVLGGMGFGVWMAYNKFLNADSADVNSVNNNQNTDTAQMTKEAEKTPQITTEETAVEEMATSEEGSADIVSEINNDKILFGQLVDSDKDGLDNERENQLGLDPYKADFDSDGLNDGEEILWKTDPKNKDTDGDGYLDGMEVRNGYNPLGIGKIQWSTAPVTSTPATTTSAIST